MDHDVKKWVCFGFCNFCRFLNFPPPASMFGLGRRSIYRRRLKSCSEIEWGVDMSTANTLSILDDIQSNIAIINVFQTSYRNSLRVFRSKLVNYESLTVDVLNLERQVSLSLPSSASPYRLSFDLNSTHSRDIYTKLHTFKCMHRHRSKSFSTSS